MEVERLDQPRRFSVGREGAVEISHCANVALAPDEQVTFTTAAGGELDVVRKSWGFYATPSLNRRLPEHGLHAFLVHGESAAFVLLAEDGHEAEFEAYLAAEGLRVVARLDSDAALERLLAALGDAW
jgi:hypothetical protein